MSGVTGESRPPDNWLLLRRYTATVELPGFKELIVGSSAAKSYCAVSHDSEAMLCVKMVSVIK